MNLRSVVVTARRFIAIDGYDRALALAAKAFVAVVPLVLVLAAWAPAGARQRAGAALWRAWGWTAPSRPSSASSSRGPRTPASR
jgi:hypothetical protein